MGHYRHRHTPALSCALAAILIVCALGAGRAAAQSIVTEITRTGLRLPRGIMVDAAGNIYVSGASSHNVFKITLAGVVAGSVDRNGDGDGNGLGGPQCIALDGAGNVYVAGFFSSNAFKITPRRSHHPDHRQRRRRRGQCLS